MLSRATGHQMREPRSGTPPLLRSWLTCSTSRTAPTRTAGRRRTAGSGCGRRAPRLERRRHGRVRLRAPHRTSPSASRPSLPRGTACLAEQPPGQLVVFFRAALVDVQVDAVERRVADGLRERE
ncbi:hypothetical protein SEVIR_2G050216v4 [Setaria viridis]